MRGHLYLKCEPKDCDNMEFTFCWRPLDPPECMCALDLSCFAGSLFVFLEGRLSPELLRSTLACTCWPFFRKGRRGTKNKLKLTKNYHKMCPIRLPVVSRWFHFLFIVFVTLVLFVIVLFGIIYRCKFVWVIVTANIYYISVYSNFLCWVLDSDWSIMINVQCNPTTRLLRSWFILL